jgi:cytochrome c-type biogenesis protein CcmH
MSTFVFLAAALIIAVIALIAVPLLRRKPVDVSPAPWAALIGAGVLAFGSVVLYVHWTNWSWAKPAADVNSPETMVAHLARKLEQDPANLDGWLMLGRSYTALRQYPLAARAFRRANQLADGKNSDALVGEAEALALGDETELDRRAGRLIEQALALDPNSGKALFFGAAAAMRRGELPLARDRFAKLLALNPPDSIKPLLQKQIEAIDRHIAGLPDEPDSGQPPQVAANQGTAPVAGGASRANDPSAKVRINVTVAPALSQSATGASPLFVFVRDPDRPGPPLAVKRLESHFPQTVELTASDSMMPGRAIAAGQKVQVVARIARSGNPVGASGDLFGESAYMVGRDGLINIVIDRVTP